MKYADSPTARAEIEIAAPPEAVWALVTDIHQLPKISTELQEVRWLDGAEGAELGHRFEGRNVHKAVGEWRSVSRIVEFSEFKAFAWAVGDPEYPAALWRFELEPSEAGTLLSQSGRIGPGRSNLSKIIEQMPEREDAVVARRISELQAGIEANLAVFKELAEQDG